MANSRKGQKPIPWTSHEEDILIGNVKKNVTNLSKAFEQTSKETLRSPNAVAAHWYSRTSKDDKHVLFLTCSGKHVAINRKNGKGKPSKVSVFKKICAVLGLKY
jgi:hypothetical protein